MTIYVKTSSQIYALLDESTEMLARFIDGGAEVLKEDSEEVKEYLAKQEARMAEATAMQELAKFSDLSDVIEVAKKKGYPSLSALLIAALAAVPDFKRDCPTSTALCTECRLDWR